MTRRALPGEAGDVLVVPIVIAYFMLECPGWMTGHRNTPAAIAPYGYVSSTATQGLRDFHGHKNASGTHSVLAPQPPAPEWSVCSGCGEPLPDRICLAPATSDPGLLLGPHAAGPFGRARLGVV